jgi:hypothetical protein
VKEVLRDQNDADVSVMAAFRKRVAHLLGIDVVQQIVEDHEHGLPRAFSKNLSGRPP